MTTISNVATRILAENNYTTSDCTAINCEYLIKKAVEHFNLKTSSTVSFIPGTGTESLTATDQQLTIIQNLSTQFLRAFVDSGPNGALGGINVSTLTADPQYSYYMMLIEDQIKTYIGMSFDRV